MTDEQFKAAKEIKRAAVRARKQSAPRKRKSRFDAEHYAFMIGTYVSHLIDLANEYPERFAEVLDGLLGNADVIDELTALARNPKVRAIINVVADRLGGPPAPGVEPKVGLGDEVTKSV